MSRHNHPAHPALLRDVYGVAVAPDGRGGGDGGDRGDTVVSVRALRCAASLAVPGYVTGEPLAEQGTETTMPNLPDVPLPELTEYAYELRIRWAAPETVRLTIAPAGAPVLDDDGTGLGIVTDPAYGRDRARPEVTETADAVWVRTDRLHVRVGRRPFALLVEDAATGAVLLRTAERLRQVAGFPLAPAVLAEGDARAADGDQAADSDRAEGENTTLHLELGPDEDVLGFGEQFSRVVKNGQRLRLRVEDALGTGTGMAYKPVPVWHSSRGCTALLNTGAQVVADVGHTRPDVLGLGVADSALDLYLIAGNSPKDRLTSYTALTGRAEVPPLWALGYWLGRCRYHSAAQMLAVADELRARQVPCDVLHADPDWLVVDRLNCDFVWNRERFGDRAEFVAALRERGLRLSVWELPYLDSASPRYATAEEHGFLVRDAAGEIAAVTGTPAPDGRPRALLDFTNPRAREWWQSLHEEFFADGVAVFKTDFGEGLPDDAALADGTPANHAHNLYPLRYNQAVSEVTARCTGRAPLVWGRSGWAGSHRLPGQWGGDAESTVAGMRATVRGGLSYALSAPGFWSHDIGGFFGPELTAGLFVRWTQLGALSPLMRAHGLRPREPWAFGEEPLRVVREWIRLRYSLLPYLWQAARESAERGWPMLRPLWLEFPDDEIARSRDDAFLLGADLLVVPVFDDGEAPVARRFYVPRGRWTDLLTDAVYEGPGFHTEVVPLERMPVLVREGAVIPRIEVGEEGPGDIRSTDDLGFDGERITGRVTQRPSR